MTKVAEETNIVPSMFHRRLLSLIFAFVLFAVATHSFAQQAQQPSPPVPESPKPSEPSTKPTLTEPASNDPASNEPVSNDPESTEAPSTVPPAKVSSETTERDRSASQSTTSFPFREYTATYNILDGKKSVGIAKRKLRKFDSLWQMEMSTEVEKWFYEYKFVESSSFEWIDNGIRSLSYTSDTQRSFKDDRTIHHSFDWQNHIETGHNGKKQWELPLNTSIYDNLNVQMALRLKASQKHRSEQFRVSYKGQRETYAFVNEGVETIETPLGSIEAVLFVQRVDDKNDKHIQIWLAPALDYVPVQFAQIKKQKVEGVVRLRSIDFNPAFNDQ